MDFQHKISDLKNRPAGYWIGLANDRLPAAVSLLLVIAIAWYLAKLFWVLTPASTDFDWSARPSYTGGSLSRRNDTVAVDFSAIVNAHLFGEPGSAAVPAQQAIDAPETRLNLKLRGTIAAGDENYAHAIIADGNGEDNVYFIKASLPGGAVLHEVYPDRVILNRAGTLETLKLPRVSEALGKPARPSTAGGRPASNSNAGSIRQVMQQGPAGFTDVLRPQPYMPNGVLKGYRVYPGRDRRRFSALGLRPGDLVTDINGQPLDNLQSGMDVFRKLGDASQITVTIERNGSPMALTLDTSKFTETLDNSK
jgi:general secretion pathway protein C